MIRTLAWTGPGLLPVSSRKLVLRSGAVGHQESTVPPIEAACKQVNPGRDDQCNVFQKVVQCSEPEVFGNLEPPGKAFIRVAPEAERARV